MMPICINNISSLSHNFNQVCASLGEEKKKSSMKKVSFSLFGVLLMPNALFEGEISSLRKSDLDFSLERK
jgi:hypothetical protein